MATRTAAIGMALGIALSPVAGAAQTAGDAAAGAALAQRWCVTCHVAGSGGGPVVQGPPSFQTIARERSPEQIRGFLAQPHPPMPPVELSRVQTDDLLAWLATLR